MLAPNKYLKIIFRQTIIWFIAFTILRFIRNFGEELNEGTPWLNSLNFIKTFGLYFFIALVSGLFFGTYEYFFNKYFARKNSFGITVFWGTLGYLIVIITFLISLFVIINLFFNSQLGREEFWKYLTQGGGLVMVFYCLLVGFLIEFVKQIDKKFGPGNLKKMLLGKFYEPKEEERIFMFLDMRSSTTIAEKLGHYKFSQLIQDCFKDIDVIIPYQAEIYQYVGDEIVLTWEKEKGLIQSNCIRAFFAYLDRLNERKSYYQSKYKLIPEFKAGVNMGKVTVAEVGEIKREICYYGDTLNTAARIQSKCNEYQKNLLVAGKVIKALPKTADLKIEEVGQVKLRGKQEAVEIFSIIPYKTVP